MINDAAAGASQVSAGDPSQVTLGNCMPTDHFVSAPDGLRLYVCSYGRRSSPSPAVICLPGLARSSADFHVLASALAGKADDPRYVLALDYRGRGRSDYDRNARNYNVAVELSDLIAVLTAFDIGRAVVVGTSRGGILAMLLASARPGAVAGIVLNDIGPVIESRGLARIKSYVGKLPQPKNFKDGAEILRRLFGAQFPRLSSDEWVGFARRTFKEQQGSLIPTYDVRLARMFDGVNIARALPPLWREFDALAHIPVMLIRGANSDVLSAATVSAVRARRPDIETIEVPDQGHAPLLVEDEIIQKISAFVSGCDRSHRDVGS